MCRGAFQKWHHNSKQKGRKVVHVGTNIDIKCMMMDSMEIHSPLGNRAQQNKKTKKSTTLFLQIIIIIVIETSTNFKNNVQNIVYVTEAKSKNCYSPGSSIL